MQILNNLINIIYWISLFLERNLYSISLDIIILVILLYLFVFGNVDKWIIKNKCFTYIALIISNILLNNHNIFQKFSTLGYAYLISTFITIFIFAVCYYTLIMLIYTITELKKLCFN